MLQWRPLPKRSRYVGGGGCDGRGVQEYHVCTVVPTQEVFGKSDETVQQAVGLMLCP